MSDPFAINDPGDPAQWPIGSRVVVPEFEDMHFFRHGSTGTVSRHADRRYLGVIVRLDQPIRCDHGHYEHVIEEFNFNARDLASTEKGAPRECGHPPMCHEGPEGECARD